MAKKSSPQITKKTTKKTAAKNAKFNAKNWFPGVREASTMNDAKNAILMVSLAINLAVFVGWLALRITTQYDQQVFNFLFVR